MSLPTGDGLSDILSPKSSNLPSYTSLNILDCDSFKEPAWIFSFVIMPNMDFRDVFDETLGNAEIHM